MANDVQGFISLISTYTLLLEVSQRHQAVIIWTQVSWVTPAYEFHVNHASPTGLTAAGLETVITPVCLALIRIRPTVLEFWGAVATIGMTQMKLVTIKGKFSELERICTGFWLADELKALAALPLTPAVKLGLMNGQFTFSELALAGTSATEESHPTPTTKLSLAQPAPDATHSTDGRNTELNFPILLATLRAVNDENPFVGSSSSKSKAWDAVYKVYKDRGGTKEIGWLRAKVSECIAVHEETVKTPQASQDTPSSDTEGVSTHVPKSKKPTQLIRNLVSKNHIMLASVLQLRL
ncbi:hypothetical protein EV360DRAFT_77039 [Lentinula raphanica]|nr:hypothetical protein EV360DRAFT_77039 [Lentinula raphanica]